MRTIARVPSRQLWQHRVYLDLHPVFAFVPVESVIRDRQTASYAALREAVRSGDASPFLAFSLEATRDALNRLAAELRPEPATVATRLARALPLRRCHLRTRRRRGALPDALASDREPRSTPISARGPSRNGMRRLRFTWAPRSARLAA